MIAHVLEEDLRDPARPTVVLKPRSGKHSATIIILHGLGDSARGWQSGAQIFAERAPHAKFVVPTAPTIPITMQMGMPAPAWCNIEISSPAELQKAISTKPGHIDASVREIVSIIRRESAEHGIPPSRIMLVGFSLGGCVAAWVALQMLLPCAGLVMLSSAVLGDMTICMSPVYQQVPVLFCHGASDFLIPMFGAKLSKDRLESAGVQVQFHEFSGGHEVTDEVITLACGFIAEKLPPMDTSNAQLQEEAARAAAPGGLLPPGLDEAPRIPDGATVTIRGLKSQPQHNGVVGTVVGHNPTNGRFTVQLANADAPLALKAQNLTQHISDVTILADGITGAIFDYNDDTQLFRIRVGGEEGDVREVPAEGVRLPNGTVVRVVGLTSEKGRQINDRMGRIFSFGEEEQRYIVDLGSERHKMKPPNVQP